MVAYFLLTPLCLIYLEIMHQSHDSIMLMNLAFLINVIIIIIFVFLYLSSHVLIRISFSSSNHYVNDVNIVFRVEHLKNIFHSFVTLIFILIILNAHKTTIIHTGDDS